jgi:hypothetical protein
MLNAAASLKAKESGQQLALFLEPEWKDAVLLELRGWLAIHKAQGHSTMTFEQFRHEARNQPASFKAWGALPRVACAAGLLAPMKHPDGSPVVRAAESVKTHGHCVRVWRLVDSFSPPATGDGSPSGIETGPAQARHQPSDIEGVGIGLRERAQQEGMGG